jgi:hypothetical protein
MERDQETGRISRREIIKWFTAAAAASQMSPLGTWAQEDEAGTPATIGYGKDPKVTDIYKPGDVWPLTLSRKQRDTVTVLADVILPKDDWGPAASELGVSEFIDEWVSAPYPRQRRSRETILPGLEMVDALSQERHGKSLAELSRSQISKLIDDAAKAKGARSQLGQAESFFYEFTGLCMGAYYATPEGWKAIGYVGNVPLPTFDGPPQEVLDKLGLEQTVKG